MATLKVLAYDFMLQSTWKCEQSGWVANGQLTWKLPAGQPSLVSNKVVFPYSLPSGIAITSSKIWATISGMYTGYSVLTANGNKFKYRNGQEYGADVLLTETSGSIEVTFSYKANGNRNDGNNHISTVNFTNIYLDIEYEGSVGETGETGTYDDSKFIVPPQSVCIYHQTTGKLYMFDGVTKIQHHFATQISEEAKSDTKDTDKWVNNAKNDPDKVTLDVVMSDVYTDDGNMTLSTGWDLPAQQDAYNASKNAIISDFTRSGNAVKVLHRLKEAREKVTVITPQYVHVDMLIAGITVSQDSNCPCGWIGSIDFQHATKPKEKKEYDKGKDTGSRPTTSIGFGEYNKKFASVVPIAEAKAMKKTTT